MGVDTTQSDQLRAMREARFKSSSGGGESRPTGGAPAVTHGARGSQNTAIARVAPGPLDCPVCAARRKARAEAQKRWRAKLVDKSQQ